jgi:hypothetical protein
MTDDQFFLLCLFIGILGLIIGWVTTNGFKSQYVRILDILIFGPFLIYVAIRPSFWTSLLLIFIGTSTMAYNFKNYLAQEDT